LEVDRQCFSGAVPSQFDPKLKSRGYLGRHGRIQTDRRWPRGVRCPRALCPGHPTGDRSLALGARPVEINAPAVNATIARRLFASDPAAQQETLARLLGLPGPLAPRLAAPVGGLAGQMVGPGLTLAVNCAAGMPFMGRPR
jgi:hypothetical protein